MVTTKSRARATGAEKFRTTWKCRGSSERFLIANQGEVPLQKTSRARALARRKGIEAGEKQEGRGCPSGKKKSLNKPLQGQSENKEGSNWRSTERASDFVKGGKRRDPFPVEEIRR